MLCTIRDPLASCESLALVLEFFAPFFGLSPLEHVPVSISFTCVSSRSSNHSIRFDPSTSPHLPSRHSAAIPLRNEPNQIITVQFSFSLFSSRARRLGLASLSPGNGEGGVGAITVGWGWGKVITRRLPAHPLFESLFTRRLFIHYTVFRPQFLVA
jgi:hypothetical protein